MKNENENLKPVIVVNDSDVLRFVISEDLRDAGYLVYEAESKQAALNLMFHNKGPYFALVTDVDMPSAVGEELIRDFTEKGVLFSAYVMVSGHLDHPVIKSLQKTKLNAPFYALVKPIHQSSLRVLFKKISTTTS